MGEMLKDTHLHGDLHARLHNLECLIQSLMQGPTAELAKAAAPLTHFEARSPSYPARELPGAGPIGFGTGRAKLVRTLIRQRRQRDQYFPADLFADPAWDMMLDLYAAHYEQRPVSVSSLCIAAAVPATTALRWIKTMVDEGRFLRICDPQDGRRVFVALAEDTRQRLDDYFDDLAG